MTELRMLAVCLLVFETVDRVLLERGRKPDLAGVLWMAMIGGVVFAGASVFGEESRFLPAVTALPALNLLRHRFGLVGSGTSLLERWRYVPPAAVFVLGGEPGPVAAVFAAVALCSRRNLRGFLIAASGWQHPFRLSSVDIEQILPAPVRYEPPPGGEPSEPEGPPGGESGMTLMELIVGMTLLVVISTSIFVASLQRSARLRQVRENARTREAAVSALERACAAPFAELAAEDGRTFTVPGDGERGEVRVEFSEEGLARIEVVAPRRGATPIRLATMRTRRLP
jgi:hypothetical protein